MRVSKKAPPKRRMRKPPTMRTAPRPGFARLAPSVVAVDSAKRNPAWALAEGGELIECGFDFDPGTDTPLNRRPDVVVVEVSPPRGNADGNPHNVFEMNVGGALCAGSMRGGEVVLLYPSEWTGTAPGGKPPRHWAVWGLLTIPERRVIVDATSGAFTVASLGAYIEAACDAIAEGRAPKYGGDVHNLLDAVGILLFAVGRMGRGGARVRGAGYSSKTPFALQYSFLGQAKVRGLLFP